MACEKIARRSVVDTATPNPRLWTKRPPTTSACEFVPSHQNRTAFGWNPVPVTWVVLPGAPVPMLKEPDATFTPSDTSRRDSQVPAVTSVFVVASRYQQAACPGLSVTVFAAPAPCVEEATLFDVQEFSVAWVLAPGPHPASPPPSRPR